MKMVFILTAAAITACASEDQNQDPPSTIVNAQDVPIDGLSSTDVARFHAGDDLFDLPFRAPDGLGPYFIRSSCGACHSDGSRGPGLVQKMAIVLAAGFTASCRGRRSRRSRAATVARAIRPATR